MGVLKGSFEDGQDAEHAICLSFLHAGATRCSMLASEAYTQESNSRGEMQLKRRTQPTCLVL